MHYVVIADYINLAARTNKLPNGPMISYATNNNNNNNKAIIISENADDMIW